MNIPHGMEQLLRLPDHCLPDCGMAVPMGDDRKPGRQVKKTVSINVPHIRSLGGVPEHRKFRRQEGNVSVLVPTQSPGQFERARTRYRRFDFRQHRGGSFEFRVSWAWVLLGNPENSKLETRNSKLPPLRPLPVPEEVGVQL